MAEEKRLCVAIVGAGIAGLTLAVALNTFDLDRKIEIDLYESTPELSEIGAGINVLPNMWEILKEIGLRDTLIPLFDHYPDFEPRVIFEIRKADQGNGFKVIDIMTNGGALRIHRADFQLSLLRQLPLPASGVAVNSTCKLHLSHKLIDYQITSHSSAGDPRPITLFFADKSNKTCDMLVGADGIKSTVRQLFLSRLPNPEKYEMFLDPVWSGTVAYRGLVDKAELKKVFPGHRALDHPGIMYVGKGAHCVVYPVSGGNSINVVAAVRDKSKQGTAWKGPWKEEVTQTEFLDLFVGWEEEFQALISCIRRPTKWALHHLNHLDVFAKGKVFLIGDSAHAMVPHLGAGAAAGIEDAYILASLLTQKMPTHSPLMQRISSIADIYNSIRVPQAINLSKASIENGKLCRLESPGFERFRVGDDIPRHRLVEQFHLSERMWSWNTPGANADRKRATELMSTAEYKARL